MFSLKTTLTAAVATLGLFFASATESQAQSFGVNLNYGRTGFSYYQNDGYAAYPTYALPPRTFVDPCVHPYRHVHGVTAGSVVIPERYHWTPYRGLHTHGTVVVPTYTGRTVFLPY